MNIVPRSVKASYIIKSIENFSAKCSRGLLPPKKYLGKQINYLIKEWCILAQSSQSGWVCISNDTRIRFNEKPLMNKLCPGNNKLRITHSNKGLVKLELIKEPCWEKPPEGFYFCKKHFNTYYGQYIRYVFGTAKPNKNNPFFRLPALLYTIYYGGEALKVGTTIIIKGFRRFMEQPHFLTSFLYIGSNIEVVRRLEIGLSKNTPLSQSPKTKIRLRELRSSLRKDPKELRKKFLCRIMSYLERVKDKPELTEVKEIMSEISTKGFHINNILTLNNKELLYSFMPESVDEASRFLRNADCIVKSLSQGLLVMDCGDKIVSVPYEILRDRLIKVEDLKAAY